MIRALMELGVMVEPEAAKMLEAGSAERITDSIKRMEPRPLSIDAALAKRILADISQPKLLKKITGMKSMSIPDLVAAYNERYNALQRILLKNPLLGNAVSIASAAGPCAVIGMVSGRNIEDPSGSKRLMTGAKLLDGDVIGAVGLAEGDTFRAVEIIFPGIQLKERAEAAGLFSAGLHSCAIKTDATAFFDLNGTVVVATDAKLEQTAEQLNVPEKEAALELLKRRHLANPPRDYLEPQPDFLIFNSTDNFSENHKGMLVIGVKERSKAIIDACERTVKFEQPLNEPQRI